MGKIVIVILPANPSNLPPAGGSPVPGQVAFIAVAGDLPRAVLRG
jgi:hypothetical protein